MTVHLDKYGISYFSVPKCACSSLKHWFFEIENGFEFRTYRANGEIRHVHNAAYPSRQFNRRLRKRAAGNWRFAVVRDPVQRLLSCYGNRVVQLRELGELKVAGRRRRNLMLDPDLHTFVAHLGDYRRLSPSIAHHTRRLTFFLGKRPAWFDRIYDISELPTMIADVAERVGEVPELRRVKSDGAKFTVDMLSDEEIGKIRRFYADDYRIYGPFFGRRPAVAAAPAFGI